MIISPFEKANLLKGKSGKNRPYLIQNEEKSISQLKFSLLITRCLFLYIILVESPHTKKVLRSCTPFRLIILLQNKGTIGTNPFRWVNTTIAINFSIADWIGGGDVRCGGTINFVVYSILGESTTQGVGYGTM